MRYITISFYNLVYEEITQGQDVCIVTIIKQIGSTPRKQGASLLVRSDGSIKGSIGGGRLESEAIFIALEALAYSETRLMPFRLKGIDVAETEMLCGGNVDIYIEPIWAADTMAHSILAAITQAIISNSRAVLVTLILPGPAPYLTGRKLLLCQGQPILGSLNVTPNILLKLETNLASLLHKRENKLLFLTQADGSQITLFLESIDSIATVYLFGAGHISLHLAPLIKMIGFRLVIIDDREKFANHKRFPQADEILINDFKIIFSNIKLNSNSYVVIITRGHLFDKEVLHQVLLQPTAYVGMIGSLNKRNIIYKALEQEGFSTQELAKVYSPIGVNIGAQTPEEIAVSIAAELIAKRANKKFS